MSCHYSLLRHQLKMPPHACANDLELPSIPPELQELTDLERQVISLHKTFMTIFLFE